MTPPDEARDALARELAQHRAVDGTYVLLVYGDGPGTGHLAEPHEFASAILSRLAASGWVVVPEGEVERLRAALDSIPRPRGCRCVACERLDQVRWELRAALIPALATEPDRETTP